MQFKRLATSISDFVDFCWKLLKTVDNVAWVMDVVNYVASTTPDLKQMTLDDYEEIFIRYKIVCLTFSKEA